MDKKNLEGKADRLKGKIKEVGGVLTDDRDLESEGKFDQLKGNVKEGLGNLRQGIKDKLDELDDNKGENPPKPRNP
ncbi:MAG TPA: CsbD family protein [Myxococcales bacterium]|nr:CsbD family protein [Myxococcales bacterium]